MGNGVSAERSPASAYLVSSPTGGDKASNKNANGSSAGANGVSLDTSTNGSTTTSIRVGLLATVEDSKSNQMLPFASSVGGSKSEGGKDTEADTEDDSLTDSNELADGATTDSGESGRFVFGEVAIDLTQLNALSVTTPLMPDNRSRSPTPSAKSPRRANRGGPGIAERPSLQQGYKIHGVAVPSNPWRHASELRTPLTGKKAPTCQFGDYPVTSAAEAPNPSATRSTVGSGGLSAGWLTSELKYAVPVKYHFATFAAQSGPIRCLSASADASQVAVVVSGGKHCYLLDTNGTLLMSVKGHLDPVLSCAQSKDGKFLVTTSADCTAVMWDLNNGKKLKELPVSSQVSAVAVTDESDVIATTSTDDIIHLWDTKSCDPLLMFQRHTASLFSIAFARRGKLAASGSSNGEIYVWDYVSGDVKCFFAKHKTAVLSVSFSHDGQRLASVDRECLRVWDLFTGQSVYSRDSKGNVLMGIDEDQGTPFRPSDDPTVRYTSCTFVAGNLIATAVTSRQFLLVDPNEGKELLMIPTKALVTAMSPSWLSDEVFVGDFAGNLYRLELTFSPRDIQAFHLDQKLPTKETRKGMDKD
jgi:WD40 repeat protein